MTTEIHTLPGTEGKTVRYKGKEYTLVKDIEWEQEVPGMFDEPWIFEPPIEPHARLTDGGEMYWHVLPFDIDDWTADISKYISGILYLDD